MKARIMILATLALALGLALGIPSAFAQDPGTGAAAFKECPGDTAQIGSTVTCLFAVENTGDFPARITSLVEQSPFPGGDFIDIECSNGGITYGEGDVLPQDLVCAGSFQVPIADNPALCGQFVRDLVSIELSYEQFTPPLVSGAFATHTTEIVCPADITVAKTADALSKVGDPVAYSITVCNAGDSSVNRTSVIDSLVGDLSASFPATLAAGACGTHTYNRTVLAGDADPLVNTVTAIYGDAETSDTATASASTNLFQPSVSLTKVASAASGQVGDTINYTITASNTGSADSPACVGFVVDAQLGINAAVSIAAGASSVVSGSHVLAASPDPFVNTATLTCSPAGFPNVLTASASATVDVLPPPPGGEGCTPGYWKQSQHFDSWVGYAPSDSYETVFGVSVPGSPTLLDALNAGGGGINALMRHSVAALLNSSNAGVDSEFTTAQVIALVQAALAPGGDIEGTKNQLAAANELGCPLN